MGNRIVFGWALRNRCEHCALGERQLGDILAEIAFRCDAYAQGVLTEVDCIEVILENPVFVYDFFQLEREVLLLKLSFELVRHGLLACPFRENRVFKKLLRDGTCALRKMKTGSDAL